MSMLPQCVCSRCGSRWGACGPKAYGAAHGVFVDYAVADKLLLLQAERDALAKAVTRLDDEVATLRKALDAVKAERDEERQALLDAIPHECRVRSCEGGGPENLEGSLAISVTKLVSLYEDAKLTVKHAKADLAASRDAAPSGEAGEDAAAIASFARCRNYLFDGSDIDSIGHTVAAICRALTKEGK